MALLLDMSDHDLTDRYVDERSSVTSSLAGRHPRGDSPDPYIDTDGSVTGGNSRAGSVSSASASSSRLQADMPSLSRLMAFLDDEVEDADEHGQLGSSDAPYSSPTQVQDHSSPSRGVSPGRDSLMDPARHASPNSTRSQNFTDIPGTPQPPQTDTQPTHALSNSDGTTGPQGDLQSRSPNEPMTRPWQHGSSRHHAYGSLTSTTHDAPDARRSPGTSTVRREGDIYRQGSANGFRETRAFAHTGEAGEYRTPENKTGEELDADDVDSVVRLAEEVMREFESIVAKNREPPAPTEPMLSQTSSNDQRAPLQGEDDLMDELRMARAQIAHLQDELRSVCSAVIDLRSREQQHERNLPKHGSSPPHKQRSRLSREDEATLRVAQHLLAVHSLSPKDGSHIDTVEHALRFVRQIDSVVHGGGQSSRESSHCDPNVAWRREEAVFSPSNLETLVRRVEGWERIARAKNGVRS